MLALASPQRSHIRILSLKKLIKLKEVLCHVPVSRATLYVMIKEQRFPQQIHLGGSGAFWVAEEVDTWIQDRSTSSGPRPRSCRYI